MPLAYNSRGFAHRRRGENDQQAIADLSEAIRLDPGLALAFKNRGDAFFQKDNSSGDGRLRRGHPPQSKIRRSLLQPGAYL